MDPRIRVILPRPNLRIVNGLALHPLLDTIRFIIDKDMLRTIPPAKTQVQTADKSDGMIDRDDFFVVGPEKDVLSGEAADVAGRTLDKDVGVETEETVFCVRRVDGDGCSDVLVDDDVDFDAFLSLPLEKSVESPFLGVRGGSSHV
jgi:hypothetical protein